MIMKAKKQIYNNIFNNKDVIIVKNFCKIKICNDLIKASQLYSKKMNHFQIKVKNMKNT